MRIATALEVYCSLSNCDLLQEFKHDKPIERVKKVRIGELKLGQALPK